MKDNGQSVLIHPLGLLVQLRHFSVCLVQRPWCPGRCPNTPWLPRRSLHSHAHCIVVLLHTPPRLGKSFSVAPYCLFISSDGKLIRFSCLRFPVLLAHAIHISAQWAAPSHITTRAAHIPFRSTFPSMILR